MIREFDPATILLKHSEMPTQIYIIIKGEVQVLSHTKEQKSDHEIVTVKTDPGSRVATLIQ